ncbi:D-alanyl-D-alanine carboxypeptidase [Oscillibacter sp. MSJ-2]|uniref:D-alanyl-D-alanine carboxypeptidase n=1 Tax=Dysosmobacter acutus TaxID=2841504 RepID=A0ABS6FAH0_9FIRM|nr:D-alanyl-D-alanine carboxypeptidase family protein [Dysosmobacter acutus]MBU5627291.1 D-alanyl-D-alanine carboxypeptidase [Dysosmobacter acutus]
MPTIRRVFSFLFAVLLLSVMTCRASAVSTSATSSILLDAGSGRVLYEHNADKQMLIASTTKIMTALVAIENGDLDQVVTVKRTYTLVEGSSMYLKEGEKLTLETLLYGLMLCSGNDAALAVADAVGGSDFIDMMNDKAEELGMSSTSFANPNGLDDEKHYSTARDMAILAAEAMKNQTFVRIASTKSVSIGGRLMSNHNKLLNMVDGCLGLKTGYTKAAGRTLVSCVQRHGQMLVAVTLQDGNDWADHAALYDYGFSTYPASTQVTAGERVGVVGVTGGTVSRVPLAAADTFSYPLAQGEKLRTETDFPEEVSAPLYAGTPLGEIRFYLGEQEVGCVELVCGQDVELDFPEPVSFLHRIFSFLP